MVVSKQIQEVRVDTRERWSHPLRVNEAIIVVKLDTGASANLISERDYMSLSPRPKLRKACVRLTDYNNKEIASLGSCVLDCVGNSDKVKIRFVVVTAGPSLLGHAACERLALVKRILHRRLSELSE